MILVNLLVLGDRPFSQMESHEDELAVEKSSSSLALALLLNFFSCGIFATDSFLDVVGVASKQYRSSSKPIHLHEPFANNNNYPHLPQSTRKNNAERVKLWSVSNGGGSQDDDGTAIKNKNDNDDGETSEPMTLQKASKLLSSFWEMASPYYQESQPGRRLFYGMIILTLMNSSVSVAFSYISKDFWNALSTKDTAEFYSTMLKFGEALVVGAPVAVLYR